MSQELADSRGLQSLAELPGAGLGVQIGVHIYPLHTRVVTVGLGGELAIGRVAGRRRRPAPRRRTARRCVRPRSGSRRSRRSCR